MTPNTIRVRLLWSDGRETLCENVDAGATEIKYLDTDGSHSFRESGEIDEDGRAVFFEEKSPE